MQLNFTQKAYGSQDSFHIWKIGNQHASSHGWISTEHSKPPRATVVSHRSSNWLSNQLWITPHKALDLPTLAAGRDELHGLHTFHGNFDPEPLLSFVPVEE